MIRRGHYVYPFSFHLTNSLNLRAQIRTSNTQPVLTSSSALNIGQWYHLGLTYLDGSRIIYIDGLESNSDNFAGTLSTLSRDTYLGMTPDEPNEMFNGIIDDVRIYNRVLTAQQIAELHSGPSAPNCGEGEITSECFCESQLKSSGYCCSDIWRSVDCVLECVDLPALTTYIGDWKQGSMGMFDLIQKLAMWKAGTGCP